MVRTRDAAGVKVAGAKASRKGPPPAPVTPSSADTNSAKNKYAGGNPYCPRETPAWQKPITQFFSSANNGACSSGEGSSSSSSAQPTSAEQPASAEQSTSAEQPASAEQSASTEQPASAEQSASAEQPISEEPGTSDDARI